MEVKDLYNNGEKFAPNVGVSLLDEELAVDSSALSLNGYIATNGKYADYAIFRSSDFISLSGYSGIKVSSVQGSSFVAYAIYDADKNKVKTSAFGSAGTAINDDIAVEEGYAYVRFCKSASNSSYSAKLVKDGIEKQLSKIKTKIDSLPSAEELKKTDSVLKGKKVAFIGDSITQGVGASSTTRYSTVFCSLCNCTEKNLGVAGDKIAADGNFINRATSANIGDADLVVVFGGTNDFTYPSNSVGDYFILADNAKGRKTKTRQTDRTTFSGGLHDLILQIRSVNSSAQILFITILNRGVYYGSSETTYNDTSAMSNRYGDYLQDYNKCIKEICSFYSIPVFDLNSAFGQDWQNDNGITGVLSSMDSDGIHPNALGHARIAKLLHKFVESNMVF